MSRERAMGGVSKRFQERRAVRAARRYEQQRDQAIRSTAQNILDQEGEPKVEGVRNKIRARLFRKRVRQEQAKHESGRKRHAHRQAKTFIGQLESHIKFQKAMKRTFRGIMPRGTAEGLYEHRRTS